MTYHQRAISAFFGLVAGVLTSCGGVEFSGNQGDQTAPQPQSEDAQPEELQEIDAPEEPIEESQPAEAIPQMTFQLEHIVPGGIIQDSSVEFDVQFGITRQNITLREQPASTLTFQQTDRPTITDTFTQGTSGQEFSETFSLSEAGILDLVVVIDNSGSMYEEQLNLSEKLDPLLTSIRTTNWQIGVVTTDDSCLRTMVDRSMYQADEEDAREKFLSAVQAGTSGSNTEMGIPNAVDGLLGKCQGTTQTWTRPGGVQAALIVSDEDNCGSEFNPSCRRQASSKAQHFVDSTPAGSRAYGIFWHPSDSSCQDAYGKGNEYETLIDLTGGAWGSICDEDYTSTLERISADVKSILKRQFILQQAPDAGTIVATVDGRLLADDEYTINGNMIEIIADLADSTVDFAVNYRVGSTPRFDRVLLSEAPAEETIAVTINDQTVPSTGYQWNSATGEILFSSQPEDLSTVKVSFRRDLPLIDQIRLPTSVLPETVTAEVDGSPFDGFDLNASHDQILFREPLLDAQQAIFRYKTAGHYVTSYAILDLPENPESVRVIDVVSGQEIPHQIQANWIVFDLAEVRDGREVTVEYDFGSAMDPVSFRLPYSPIDGSVTVTADGRSDLCGADLNVVEGDLVTFSCSQSEVDLIKVDFAYVRKLNTTIHIEGDIPEEAQWWVWIDDTKVSQFTREGNSIQLQKNQITPYSLIKIVIFAATF